MTCLEGLTSNHLRRRTCTTIAALCLCLFALYEDVIAQDNFQTHATLVSKLLDRVATDNTQSDNSAWEVVALAKKLKGDPQAALAFLRENIRYEAYDGSLRGAQGTLIAKAGNSLDQAVLLGSLLTAKAQDLRIAKGPARVCNSEKNVSSKSIASADDAISTTMTDADRLVNGLKGFAREVSLTSPERELLLRYADQAQRHHKELVKAVTDGVTEDYEALTALMARPIKAKSASWLTEANHYWLQTQVDGAWIDLDPYGDPVAATQTFSWDQIPEDLYHQLEIRVMVERQNGKMLESWSVLQAKLKTDELTGKRLDLQFVPQNEEFKKLFDEELSREERKKVLDKAQVFLPVLFVGKKPIRGKAFDLDGNMAASRRDGLGSSLAAFGSALGGYEDKADSRLTGMFLEVISHYPKRKAETIRRDLIDRIGPAARRAALTNQLAPEWSDNLRLAYRLASTYQCLAIPGSLTLDYSVGVLRTHLAQNRVQLQKLLADFNEEAKLKTSETQMNLISFIGLRHQLLTYILPKYAVNAEMTPLQVNFFCEQRVVDLDGDGEVVFGHNIDIVENRLEPAVFSSALAWKARLLQGLVDTHLEQATLEAEAGEVLGVPEIFRQAREAGTETAVLHTVDDLTRLKLPADAMARITGDLEAGFVVVVPQRPIELDGRPRIAWWRIDEESGASLGILDTGMGQTTAQYATLVTQVASGLLCLVQYRSLGGRLLCIVVGGGGSYSAYIGKTKDVIIYVILTIIGHTANALG